MRSPFGDFLKFWGGTTIQGKWPILILGLMILASIGIAAYNFVRDPRQRTAPNVYLWIARLFIGGMWFQQTLWKLPPTFTDNPDGVSGGLRFWMEQMVKYASFPAQSALVRDVMLPNFKLFAAQVWTAETFIAVSLLLGLFTPVAGVIGMAMAANLWLGLYNHPSEWPWTYFFLIIVMGFMTATKAGRALGLDNLLANRPGKPTPTLIAKLAAILT